MKPIETPMATRVHSDVIKRYIECVLFFLLYNSLLIYNEKKTLCDYEHTAVLKWNIPAS